MSGPGRDMGGEQPGSSAGETPDSCDRCLEECSGDGEADDKVRHVTLLLVFEVIDMSGPGRDVGGEQPGSSAGETPDGYGRSLGECGGDGEAYDKVMRGTFNLINNLPSADISKPNNRLVAGADSSKPTTGLWPLAPRLWPLAPRASDPHHSLLLMSFLQATRMMAIRGGSLVDVTDKLALISHEETIACGLVQEDLMLQVR
eukprot:gene500-1907_t